MHNRLYSYLKQNNLLYVDQYGFWEGHSTDTALARLLSVILRTWEDKEAIVVIMMDLSKAFDTLDRFIFLSKLETFGIVGPAYERI